MKILLTNDDGYRAPGLLAAWHALKDLGDVTVVAPEFERSACSHTITLRKPIKAWRRNTEPFGDIFTVEGTPADCVRLACAELIDSDIDLVFSGINAGANAGVDMYYSGTVAGAREAAILGLRSVAFSHAIRAGIETDWEKATRITPRILQRCLDEKLPGPGFHSVNLPADLGDLSGEKVHAVPPARPPMPMSFERLDSRDGEMLFTYGASYWVREAEDVASDYSTIREGGIAITRIPVFGKF